MFKFEVSSFSRKMFGKHPEHRAVMRCRSTANIVIVLGSSLVLFGDRRLLHLATDGTVNLLLGHNHKTSRMPGRNEWKRVSVKNATVGSAVHLHACVNLFALIQPIAVLKAKDEECWRRASVPSMERQRMLWLNGRQ